MSYTVNVDEVTKVTTIHLRECFTVPEVRRGWHDFNTRGQAWAFAQ